MTIEPPFKSAHVYVSPEGTVIHVLVPWGPASGLVPPPTITFGDITFRWNGTDHDE